MLRRSSPLLALLLLLTLPATPVVAQGVPTLTLGSAATVNLLPPGPITADGKRISLTVLVTDENGALANGVKFRGSGASQGRLDADCPQIGNGLYNCAFTTPDRAASNQANLKLRARLASGTELEANFPLSIVADTRARITFNATPERIVLTQDSSASVVFTVVDESGAAMDGLNLVASSNVGEVRPLAPAGQGRYAATYVPPSTPFPQVATVSVWDANEPGRVFGFFRIPLVGKVDYPVDARAPNVTLTFKVGDTSFPPVVTDSSGKAQVPILVPPGVPDAQVDMVQANGARSTQTIDLQVPPFNRIALGGQPSYLPADGQTQARVRAFVVDKRGRPAEGATVTMTADQGRISAPRFLGNGLYEAMFTAPALSAGSKATIVASITGEESISADSIEISLETATPDGLTLAAEPTNLGPSGGRSNLTITMIDPNGQPMASNGTVRLASSTGPLPDGRLASPGVYRQEVAINAGETLRVQAIAAVPGNRQPVAQIVALPVNDEVLTGQAVTITVISLDRYGNPVAGAPVAARVLAGGGAVSQSTQTDGSGLGTVSYTAGPLAGFATVEFTSGGANYTAPLWQTTQRSAKGFEFPVSGGQKQGRVLARWRKLQSRVDIISASAPSVATVGGATGSPWGTQTQPAQTQPVQTQPAQTQPAQGQTTVTTPAQGTATSIQVSAVPTSVPSTGGTINVLVRLVDASGLLVPGENVILLADAGTISNKVDNGDGTFSALLTVPANPGKTSIQVTATRPAGDVAAFTTVSVTQAGGAATQQAAAPATAAPTQQQTSMAATKKPKPAKQPADANRMANRAAQLWIGWAPGGYTYDSNPCADGSDDCVSPADSELDGYDFLKAEVRAPTPGSFALGGEWFPFQEYVGFRASFARLAYSTDFEAATGNGDAHCATHFCDGMSFLNIDAQGRLPLLKQQGPLDLVLRVGYQFQDVVVFRRLLNNATGEREPRFETIGLHGLRIGIGARYTIIPLLRPHLDYNMSFGLRASLAGESFGVPGITNHNLAIGMNIFPWKGLLLDVSYDLTTRSLGLSFANEANVIQRGRLAEQAHTVRISAGWAF